MRAGRAQLLVTAQVLADEHDRRRRTSCSIARDEPAREPLAVGRRFKLDTTKNCVVETIAVGAGSASITVRAGAAWAPTITAERSPGSNHESLSCRLGRALKRESSASIGRAPVRCSGRRAGQVRRTLATPASVVMEKRGEPSQERSITEASPAISSCGDAVKSRCAIPSRCRQARTGAVCVRVPFLPKGQPAGRSAYEDDAAPATARLSFDRRSTQVGRR
jgi:hypothetical protein